MSEAVAIELDDPSHVIALLVEDNKNVLAARRNFLENQGFVAVSVTTYHDALREFRSIPRVDLVLTDINLPTDERYAGSDTSGATLAQVLRAVSTDLPIYGYSALFAEGELSPELSDAFTAYYPKGKLTPEQQIEFAQEWRQAALGHRDARGRRAQEDLKRLREAYQSPTQEFLTLRELIPGSGDDQDQSVVENVLARAGYRIKLIEPGDMRPRLEGGEQTTAGPIVLWTKSDSGLAFAEVYGFPELYGHGLEEDAAIADVLLLMDGYHEDLQSAEPNGLSEELRRLRRYLVSVFGGADAIINE